MKAVFKLTKRDSQQIETTGKYLPATNKIFDSLLATLHQKADNTYSFSDKFSETKKKRLQASYGCMVSQIAGHRFYIRQNEQNYYNSLKVDQAKVEEENLVKIERRKVVEELEIRRKMSEERERIKKEEEAKNLERRAQLEMQLAGNFMEIVKNQKREAEERNNKAKRSSKMLKAKLDEENGNTLHNFKLGTDDLETTYQFQETQFFPSEPKTNTPRKAKQKDAKDKPAAAQPGERKRLKKKVEVTKDTDSDEMLDIAVDEDIQIEDDLPAKPAQKSAPVRKPRMDPIGRDDDGDSDLGDKMPNDEDDEQVQEVNFGGQDENENTF